MISRLRSDVEGANAVEFALILPVLVLLLFGTMYGGSLFNSQQTVTQAAREGARFGATAPISAFTDEAEWRLAIVNRTRGILDVDRPLTPGAVDVCVRFYAVDGSQTNNGSAACPTPSPAGDLQGARVEVTTTRVARLELGITSIGPITLRSTATARYEPDDLE
jgi:Flp pilus assembly protein TadG